MGEREAADVYVNVTKKFKEDYYNLHMEMTHVVGIQTILIEKQRR